MFNFRRQSENIASWEYGWPYLVLTANHSIMQKIVPKTANKNGLTIAIHMASQLFEIQLLWQTKGNSNKIRQFILQISNPSTASQ